MLLPNTINDIPSAIISFKIKKSVISTPSTVLKTPVVVNKKLSVARKIIVDKIPPNTPAFFQKKESSKQIAAMISILPIIFDTPCTLVTLYSQFIRKLFFTSDSIPFASVGVNLKKPIHNNIIATPSIAIEYPRDW